MSTVFKVDLNKVNRVEIEIDKHDLWFKLYSNAFENDQLVEACFRKDEAKDAYAHLTIPAILRNTTPDQRCVIKEFFYDK